MLNSRDINLLRSDVGKNCRIFLDNCQKVGLPVLITQTVRDNEYQAYLYAQGRTRPGKIVTNQKTPTFHSNKAGLAFDFCKNVKGHEYDDPAFFKKCADIAKRLGFSWGGDWKTFKDNPHIQWDDNGKYTSSMILQGKYPRSMPTRGQVTQKMTKDTAKSILKKEAKLSDATITYLDSYRYGDDLIVKLANAIASKS